MDWQQTRQRLIEIGISESRLPERWQWRIVLTGADLTCADLSGAVQRRADLRGADLTGADLRGADLTRADLTCADLSGADLTCADLSGADLTCADLSGAVLPYIGFNPIPEPELARRILKHAEAGHLRMESWHTCKTTHCAWGWAVVENGDAGRAVEALLGIEAAGALLFPSFAQYVTVSNEEAVTQLNKIAAQE